MKESNDILLDKMHHAPQKQEEHSSDTNLYNNEYLAEGLLADELNNQSLFADDLNNQSLVGTQLTEYNNQIRDNAIAEVLSNMPPLYNRSYARDIYTEIKALASDSGDASKYFRPVIECASVLMQKQITDQERARYFAGLLFNAKDYLINRPYSIFSPQRRRRRRICERLLMKASAFLSEAPTIYASQLNDKIEVEKDTDNTKTADELSTGFGYYISDEYLDYRKAVDRLGSLPEEKKTPEITKLLDLLEGIKANMDLPMPTHPGSHATPQQLKAFEEEIFAGGFAIMRTYDMAISRCNTCLNTAADSWLVDQVNIIKAATAHTRKVFSNCISNYLGGHTPDGHTTWNEAVASKCGILYDIKSSDTKLIGAGTSTVYKLKSGNSHVYFNKDTVTVDGPAEAWDRTWAGIKELPGYSPDYDQDLQELNRIMEDILYDYRSAIKSKDQDAIDDEESALYTCLVKSSFKTPTKNMDFIKKIRLNRSAYNSYRVILDLKRIDTNSPYGRFANIVFLEFLKAFNSSYYTCHTAGISLDKVISNNNVASSRMSSLLGIDHLVVRSQTADIKDGNKTISGVLMEEASGRDAMAIYDHATPGMKYTDRTISDMAVMHVFDIITGQVDRNTKNFFLTVQGNKLSNLKMIDNDMSFGDIQPEDLKNQSNNSLPGFDIAMPISLPMEVKTKIHEMAKAPKEYFQLVFGDLLSDKEINDMIVRLKFVESKLTEEEQKIRSAAASSDDGAFIAEMISNPEFALLYYQKQLWTHAHEHVSKRGDYNDLDPEDKQKWLTLFIETHSYLKVKHIQPESEIDYRIAGIKRKWESRRNH